MFVNQKNFVPHQTNFLSFLLFFFEDFCNWIFVGGTGHRLKTFGRWLFLFFGFFLEQKKIVYVIAICVKYIVFVELLEIEMFEFIFFFLF